MSGGQKPGEKETISVLNIWIIPHLPVAGVSSHFFFFLMQNYVEQLLQRFFCPNPRVPVFHTAMNAGEETMFVGFKDSNGKSFEMDIESLDKIELQRSVCMFTLRHASSR